MIDLDQRLQRGPLKVRSLGVTHSVDEVSRQILRRRRVAFARNLTIACAAAALLGFVALRHAARPARELASAPAARPAPAAAPLPTRTTFADGSFAQLSDAHAALEVEEESPRRVVTRLRGAARFNVVARGKRAFEVQSGEVRVRVLGSEFSMAELPGGKARVEVQRGPVEVAWLGGGARLESGQSGAFPPDERSADNALARAAEASAAEPQAEAPAAKRKVRARQARQTQALEGSSESLDDPRSLMAEADAQRLHGQPEQAVKPLRSLFERYPADPRAPLAAFALGRVLLDDLHRPAEAAQAFLRARTLAPEGALAPDALAREAGAWEAAGQPERAHKLAEQYLALYPQGRHAPAMRRTLAR